jgi:hypothetical protein
MEGLAVLDAVRWAMGPELARDKLTLLVLCLLGVQVLAAHLAFRLRWRGSAWGRALIHAVRACFYLGVPAAVLWRGALVSSLGVPTTYVEESALELGLQLLGIGDPEGLLAAGRGVAMAVGLLAFQIVLWVWYARTAPLVPDGEAALSWWAALGEAVLFQVYWAFLRGVVGLYTGDPAYLALTAFLLAVLPWVLDPWRRQQLATARGYRVVQDVLAALCTAVLVYSADVLWLLILVHALGTWIGGRIIARLGALRPAPASQPAADL